MSLGGCAVSPREGEPARVAPSTEPGHERAAAARAARSTAPAVKPTNGKNRRAGAVTAGLETAPAEPPPAPTPSNGGHRTPTEAPAAEAPEPAFDPAEGSRQAYPIPLAKETAPLDGKAAAKAKKLLQRARVLYSKGEYDKAEVMLKEVVTTYPFMAEANLMLGKIFLIRGSATRDRAMINSARLMFEMARALDPEMREPAVLLELFLLAPPE